MILVLLGRPWIVLLGRSLLGQVLEVARGEDPVDQGGLGGVGGAVVQS